MNYNYVRYVQYNCNIDDTVLLVQLPSCGDSREGVTGPLSARSIRRARALAEYIMIIEMARFCHKLIHNNCEPKNWATSFTCAVFARACYHGTLRNCLVYTDAYVCRAPNAIGNPSCRLNFAPRRVCRRRPPVAVCHKFPPLLPNNFHLNERHGGFCTCL